MIKPNWDIFKAKFSENTEGNFEWFCYILFCKEFNKPLGIHRYKNQSAIETDPIEVNGELIGWQAKFYETTLSKNKNRLISTIETAKKGYPDISKLILYTNQEWGQNKDGKEPQSKKDVEDRAEELNIDLVWRTASYFESPFVVSQNELIAYHFFSLDKSVLDLIQEQQKHSENILNEIQTGIDFHDRIIEIDRSDVLKQLRNSQQISIVSGVGGVGKTAIIKKFYDELKDNCSFYIFKAIEFDLRHINDIFVNFDFQIFNKAYEDVEDKIIVIDSAEKLLDLRNTDPFKEFLLSILQNKWKVIFTTRDNYLGDLNYQFFEIYKIAPTNIYLQNLGLDDLYAISSKYNFSLPKDERLLESIRNPFHLKKYLQSYKDDHELNYIDFRENLWNNTIRKTKPAREQCFLQIALNRANSGQFFVTPNCESQILDDELRRDGILAYESPHGYFITHDIYEEWALEKIIEIEYVQKSNNHSFFQRIGQSLPVRRSFRKWVSEKLLLEDNSIKGFIEEVVEDQDIKSFWRDEVLISVLLSDYSEKFFDVFKSELLVNEKVLLKKMTFLLRIACKEVDDDFFKQLGIKKLDLFSLKYVLTKPKGHGWKSLIKFIFDNYADIGIENIDYVLPVIYDWNRKFQEGKTTRFSSLIALRLYKEIDKRDNYFSRSDDTKDKIFETISAGAFEISDELEKIFKKVLNKEWKSYRNPYYDLSVFVLTKLEGITISKALPKQVLQLADLFWFQTGEEDDFPRPTFKEIEQSFCIIDNYRFKYFPESAYQTPIYWLLQSALKETIDFILEFVNKVVQCFVENKGKDVFHKSEIILGEKKIWQYSDGNLWGAYRGGGNAPYLLKSIHMALEKFFLERGKDVDSEILESWLLYLIKNSKSASISAVVASIVLAYPEKTFNVAIILFRTKEFYFYDTSRIVFEQGQKRSLQMFQNNFGINFRDEIYENERLKACDDEHRKWSLEHQALKYQIFRDEKISDEEFEKQQKTLWKILDDFYQELPNQDNETEIDKTWRLYLARMDSRKMKPTTEETENGVLVYWNPEIEPKLKEFSEKSLQKISESMKYDSLKLWADFRMKNDDKYKQYEQYEKDPKLALKEVREIVRKLEASKFPKLYQIQYSEEEKFYLYNQSTPSDVCSVLVRDFPDSLSKKETKFCKDIIFGYASLFLQENYTYQISDGTQSAISVLPIFLEENREEVKTILLFSLFNDDHVDSVGTSFSAFAILAIHKLWEKHFRDAQSILFGYLYLKPKYEALRKRLREENYKKGTYNLSEHEITKRFLEEHEADLETFIVSGYSINDLQDVKELDLYILNTAFRLIPLKTKHREHKKLAKLIISVFAEKLLLHDRDDKIDYGVRHNFVEYFAWFVLNSPKEEVAEYVKPFLDRFNRSEAIADLFKEFVSAEDYINAYDNFWEVWNLFRPKVVELCQEGDRYWHIDKIVKSYLFAETPWRETAIEWHTLKESNKRFFKAVLSEIGHCPSALYAISKLLNDIGSSYLNDGISWVSHILENNKNLLSAKLETNSLYYLENIVKRYVYENREKVRRTKKLKQDILLILDFLTERGSVVGYLLRENIL